MGGKRKRESSVTPKLKSKKQKRKAEKASLIPSQNAYGNLVVSSDEQSDNDVIVDYDNDYRSGTPDIVLVDSDDENEDEIVVVSDAEEKSSPEVTDQPVSKSSTFVSNELAKNEDFIGFGFESSEDEKDTSDVDTYSDSGTKGSNGSGTNANRPKSLFPWVKDHDHSKQQEIADWLTMEMKDFVNYISPSSEEIVTRNKIINRLKNEIQTYWPYAEAHVFGSCATDLYLPGSDIDMVLISKTGELEHRSKLYQLSSFLRTHKLAKNIEVIAKAKVPIIKFVDPDSDIPIDISFEKTNGLDAAKKIRRWVATTPGLREMVLIVKQFLRSRRLNNVHVGGLGGYSTIILCYHFLTLHPKISTGTMSPLDNLGALLIEFFELYGRNFAYDYLIISLDPKTDQPRYLLKGNNRWLDTSNSAFSLVIQDPSDPSNNISRASHNLRDIKKAFGGAYQLLTEKCYSLNAAPYKERLGESILGDIIKYKGKERDFNDDRSKITNDALIAHGDEYAEDEYYEQYENDYDESDGADGNDKYYISDMTSEDDLDDFEEPKVTKKRKVDKTQVSKSKSLSVEAMAAKSKSVSVEAVVPKSKSKARAAEIEKPITPKSILPTTIPAKPKISTLASKTEPAESKPKVTKSKSKVTESIVSDYLGLKTSDDEQEAKTETVEDQEEDAAKKTQDKESRRDYWRQKGLEL